MYIYEYIYSLLFFTQFPPSCKPGTKPCATCTNLFGRCKDSDIAPGGVSIKCSNRDELVMHTNESFYRAYDMIDNASKADRKLLQQCHGIKINPHGVVHCKHTRSFYDPVDHMLRDPMHVLISGGVGQINIARVVKVLITFKIKLEVLADYIYKFTLPYRMGTIDKKWLSRNKFGKNPKL